MKIRFNYYKNAKKKALTVSYDDGRSFDARLAHLFDLHGIRGTFHLNGGKLDCEHYLSRDEVATVLARHEVSCHSLTHPFLERVSNMEVTHEILEDKRILEGVCGYPVRGMSYPYGTYSDKLIAQLRVLGMRYSRTTKATEKFVIPEDFMEWHPTCHHNSPKLFELLEKFKEYKYPMPLFYVWGHSYEFDRDNNWELIEKFCREAGGDDDVWYATNIEIYDYVTALRALEFSTDRTMVYNPAATDVWIAVDDAPVMIAAGATVHLGT